MRIFRDPFRQAVRQGAPNFPDRATLVAIDPTAGGELGTLYADMVASALSNIESTFAGIDENELKSAAEAIWASRNTFTLGVGVNSANAPEFHLSGFHRHGSVPRHSAHGQHGNR